LHSTC